MEKLGRDMGENRRGIIIVQVIEENDALYVKCRVTNTRW